LRLPSLGYLIAALDVDYFPIRDSAQAGEGGLTPPRGPGLTHVAVTRRMNQPATGLVGFGLVFTAFFAIVAASSLYLGHNRWP
jgi:hypothetical protein